MSAHKITKPILYLMINFGFIVNLNVTVGSEIGFCRETITHTLETECTSCHINVFTDCPDGTVKETKMEGNSGCQYEQYLGPGPNITRDGCFHVCKGNVTIDKCCNGFWGPQCDECPGGYSAPCSGNGKCDDLIDGSGNCTCDAGWTGYACEFCANSSLSGENCTQVIDVSPCQNMTCPNNSKCTVIDEEAICMCSWPYVEHENNTGNTTSVICREIDTCTLPPLCHVNASCVMTQNHDLTNRSKNCTCNSGFHGDGYQCDPIDPCQTDNGGCNLNTSDCVFKEPGKSDCFCKDGYQKDVLDSECSLIDICSNNQSACHPKAVCETVGPNNVRCKCAEGYQGDGHVCFGNILQVIKDLDANDAELAGQMTLIQGAIEKYYQTELTQHAPFTMFVPTNEGFRALNVIDYQKWLDDAVRVRQILRQHILVGEFTTDKLLNQSVFYTLQGSQAELLVASRGDSLRFRIFGSSKKAKLVRENVVASNGILHIINRVMTNTPSNTGDEQKSVYENMKLDGKYNRFKSLIDSVGNEIKDLLDDPDITVFSPNNGAFDALPPGSLEYLTSSEGRGHLLALLKNHIFTKKMEITDLINIKRITSSAGIASYIEITEMGQVQLNSKISITQSDIAASNGIMHDIDAVLLADDIAILPNNCDLRAYSTVMGPCGDCRDDGKCFPPDVATNTTQDCQYWAKNSVGKYEKMSGCALMCNRTYTTPQCCKGFYGFDCLPCPGGYKNPCNGRGKCDEGYYSEGTCTCDKLFGGSACETCADDKHFGENCTEECTCLHGECNSGTKGDGKCKRFSCTTLYTGDNCDIQKQTCNDQLHNCHAHALCIWEEERLDFRCICRPGYDGNGLSCQENDPCLEPTRGNCHLQASCTKVGPGKANCTCAAGWAGDGYFCHLETTCRSHADCHKNAECISTIPGRHICQCKADLEGNGTYCVYKDRCEVNNGGCHPKATCSHNDRSEVYVNCTCLVEEGYAGNGYSCHGNLVMEIENHPKLNFASELIKMMSSSEQRLLMDRNYTVFVGTDEALSEFGMMFKHKYEHWIKPENLMTILNYHTLLGSYKLDALVAISQNKKLETAADGFSVYVSRGSDGQFRLMPQKTGVNATVIESDIIATNGYLNVIDKIVEPYEPTDPDDYPDLEAFFSNHTEYSIFAGWLQDKGLIDKLENDMDSYTLFVVNNTVAGAINQTVTTDYLRYYIVPLKQMIVSTDNNSTMTTDLGVNHQLLINRQSFTEATVNNAPITKSDMFTYGGIVNEIASLLHPVLHECNENTESVTLGPCSQCNGNIYQCIGNASAVPGQQTVSCVYTQKNMFGVEKKKGCQGPCVFQQIVKGCCSGYFGNTCNECPGGPEFPCSGHGTCNDGFKGDGMCQCKPRFMGQLCNLCIDGWTGTNCDIDMKGCGYKNGGCSLDAICNREPNGNITCKCREAFYGDGYNCSGPCDKNNGGCHINATCKYSQSDSVSCRCLNRLIGDGRSYCMADILASLSSVTNAKRFYSALNSFAGNQPLNKLKTPSSFEKFTLFVPVDEGMPDMVLVKDDILQQIVISQESVVLRSVDFSNITLSTLTNITVTLTYNEKQHAFYANNIRIIEGNIAFTNGIVHIVERLFYVRPAVESVPESTGFPVTPVVVIIAIFVILVAVAVIIVVYRRSKKGYWDALRSWLISRQNSESDSQDAPLHDEEDEQPDHVSGLPQRDNSFGNPMYKSEDL